MDIPHEARALEARLAQAGFKIQSILDDAGVVRSTWGRWKSGSFKPRLDSWLKVKAASERALAEPSKQARAQ